MNNDQPINFNEIDPNGNYVIRITGGNDESKQKRMFLMNAAEDMYKTLNVIWRLLDKNSHPFVGKVVSEAKQAIAKAEGKY
jgi:hypothetical protein